ncbi:MAG: beta-N-acetylhexosaminidase [Candidatus Acidiferrales bacterium]
MSYSTYPRLYRLHATAFLSAALLTLFSGMAMAHQSQTAELASGQQELARISIVPWPTDIQAGSGQLPVTQSFSISLTGYSDARLERAAQRFIRNLSRQTGIPLKAYSPNSSSVALVVHTDRASLPVQDIAEDESYTLDVTSTGAKLNAPNPLGILHGFETFLQLVQITPKGFTVPAVHIEDKPRFPWRGLSIDVSRHFIPLDTLKRNIDGVAAVKMNALHLHLSDDQGFRVESKVFPKLQEMGSDGLYYTQAQIRGLIDYARDRGIRIVPEFDMPGHSTSWFVGYPELASAPGPYSIERKWGIFDPAMDPTREETYKFLDKFIGEMAALFPDRYFHIGGDEVNGKQWDANARIQEFMRAHDLKDDAALQQYFTVRVQKIVSKHHKLMIGWDEILGPGMPKDIVIQSWRGQDSLAAAAQQGYRGLLSSGYYLDGMWHASQHYAVDPMSNADAKLTSDQQKLILGGEACMWAEFVSEENIDSRIWPRTAAIAERLWSPQRVRDVDSMYRRIDALSWRLEFLGLTHRSSYTAMLGRLAGTDNMAPLRLLGDLLEPASLHIRQEAAIKAGGIETSETPLNRMVDAVPPESEAARDFSETVNAFVASKFTDVTAEAELHNTFASWQENDAQLLPTIEGNSLLRELAPVSRNLALLGAAGLQALNYIDNKEPAPDGWKAAQLAIINQAKAPQADVLLAVASSVEALIQDSASAPTAPR